MAVINIDYLIIGKIVNTHGVNGELKVLPLTDNIERFKKLKKVYIDKNDTITEHNIEKVKMMNNSVVIKIDGVNSLNDAEMFKESYIKINRSDAIKLPRDSYFISDLIDMDVSTVDGEFLGRIKEVLTPGGNDVYVVANNGKELLIPAIKNVVKRVDIENKSMTVELLEGLRDL